MNKKKLYLIAAVLVVLAMLGTGNLAYFTTRAVTHNVITTGGVDIDLVEHMLDASGETVPFENQEGLMPGSSVSKIVRVKNKEADAYIRVKVAVSAGKHKDGMNLAQDIRLDFNTSDWTYADGWYYYNKVLPKGAMTTPLFEEVLFDGEGMGNEYQNADIAIDVSAQAVQAANNPIPTGGNVTGVQGWPKN